MVHRERALLFVGLAITAATAIVLAYLPGLSSAIHFDDRLNLDGLGRITDMRTAIAFAFSGSAGPTGRPLSLISFLPHASAWPENLRPFLITNIAIHLVNGFFVGLLSWLITQQSAAFTNPQRAPWVALTVATVWLSLPLLVSSTLFVVQRMTTLATLLVLAGLCLHLLGRKHLSDRPAIGLALMTTGAFLGLVLGPLAKETAFVYPLLVLALDRTLLSRTTTTRVYRYWRLPFIIVPAILLIAYMLERLVYPGGGYDQRHFDLTERILSQGIILFDYMRLMLVPTLHEFGPFHDHYPIYGGFSATLAFMATLFWIFAAILAILFGRRWPILAFGILWFLGSHFIESTWIPLELYYEHRNYLPAVGVVLAIGLGIVQLQGRPSRLVFAGVGLYAAVLVFALLQVTSLWGNPRVAAELWGDRNPESLRAAHFLANFYVQEGFPLIGARILDEAASKDPTQLISSLESMRLNCIADQHGRTRQMFSSILERAPKARHVNRQADNDAKALESILEAIILGHCKSLDYSDVIGLASAYLDSPVTRARARTVHNYYVLKSRASGQQGDFESMMEYVITGLEYHVAVDTAKRAAAMAEEHGRIDYLLRIYYIISQKSEPRHHLVRRDWRAAVSEIEDRVQRLKLLLQAEETASH